MKIVNERHFSSVAFPIIGSGSGSFKQSQAKQIMIDTFAEIDSDAHVLIVEYKK